ncbi:Protein prune-like protein 2 [Armadillidium vulgare]|nr:Protein prune-like protein 2 [Armadillidium vulgare]
MNSGLDNEVAFESNGDVSSQSSAIQEDEDRNDFLGNKKPLLSSANSDAVFESSNKLSVSENNDFCLPIITVNDGSPADFKQQSEGYRINTSEYITPGTSIDRSLSNSYVTAKDKVSSGYSNPSFGNENATVETKSNRTSENSLPSELTTDSSPSEESSSCADKSNDLPSINPSSKDLIASPSDEFSLTPSITSSHRESTEPCGESDEEYFEEYHLPNTHENAFVRHLSFRRKVQTTPINAPDADRIEGLVRTGEFIRHGSIRRKILPEEEEEEDQVEEDIEGENDSLSFSKSIEREIREFERYLSKENLDEFPTDAKMQTTPETFEKLKRSTSTPKSSIISETNGSHKPFSDQFHNDGIMPSTENFEQNVSIEESTLRKIQECLDFSAYKDILNFSGRLSDILSPKEVEEVLSNSERYRQYLDREVFEALSLSYQEQFHSLPCTVNLSKSSSVDNNNISSNSSPNKSLPNTDSGFSSPITPKKDEEILETHEESPKSSLQFVERSGAACDGIGAQGIFVETVGVSAELKKISAPQINLDSSSDTKDEEEDDIEKNDEILEEMPTRRKITIPTDILELSDNQDNIDIATEACEKETYDERNENNSPSNFEIGSEIPPHELSAIPPPPDLIPELTASEEIAEVRHWRNVVIGGAWRRIDMKAIAPYRKCISHGGYMDDSSQSPIVVLSAARLPDKSKKDYHYIMDNLFMYVLSFVEQLVADDYILIYFSGGKLNGSGPGFHWMRRAYEMIDRRLRKNLKSLLIVHPSLWAKTILTLARPFISSKFYRKLKFVQHLTDLAMLIPLEQLEIPDAVKQADFEIMIREKKKLRSR